MYLHQLNTFDKRLRDKRTFIVSLGSVEQHGPYGPLGTDYLVQTELTKRAEKQLPDVIFLPVTPFGPCWQQVGFNGTVSLRESTLYAMITDIVESLKDRANVILLVSWHGGNKPVISKFLSEKSTDYSGMRLAQITFGDEGTDEAAKQLLGGPTDDHAGNTEVSLMLAINSAITNQPKVDDDKRPNSDFEWDRRIIEVQSDGVIDAHPKWVATPEIGEKLLTIYSDNLVRKIKNELKALGV
jgi:creatinine amidohydrolase